MVHIIGQDRSPRQEAIGLLPEQADDGNWIEDPEYSDEFEPALWIILQRYDISMDPTMGLEAAMAARDIGLLTAKFGKWSIAINWATQWAQKIPPHHLAVEFNGDLVGILSPWLTMRTCWSCGRGNPIGPDGKFHEDLLYVPTKAGPMPAVLPAHACPGRLEKHNSQVIRRPCGKFDWFAHFVTREDFQRDAAEVVAKDTGEDYLAADMAVVHDPTGQEKPRYVETNV